jgi:hypothetical protein
MKTPKAWEVSADWLGVILTAAGFDTRFFQRDIKGQRCASFTFRGEPDHGILLTGFLGCFD